MIHTHVHKGSRMASMMMALTYPILILLLAYAYVLALMRLARWLGSLV